MINNNDNQIQEFTSYYSYSFEYATELCNDKDLTDRYGYMTALPITPEMAAANPNLVLGEWYRTNKYDPRIVATKKAREHTNG